MSLVDTYHIAYEPDTQALLARISHWVKTVSADFVPSFYTRLPNYTPTASILTLLTTAEFDALKDAQARHLQAILSPDLDIETHINMAKKMAHAHEMVGVDLPVLLDGYHLYQELIRDLLPAFKLNKEDQSALMSTVEKRLLVDLEEQIAVDHQVDAKMATFVEHLDETLRGVDTLPDLMDQIMSTVLELDGIVAALFLRPDANGDLLIEATGGELGQTYSDAMNKNRVPYLHTNPHAPGGTGPAGRAWRTARIQSTLSYESSDDIKPWKEIGARLGFRSNVAIPLLDDNDRPFALLTLYSNWPRYFDTRRNKVLLRHLQNSLGHAVLHLERDIVISVKDRQTYCTLLDNECLEMHLQPIINLKSGRLSHLEALARLRQSDNHLISPGEFLPVCGKSDLFQLFRLGLDRIGQHITFLKQEGIHVPISINLPPDGLINDSYKEILFQYLDAKKIDSQFVRLEMLETQDPSDTHMRDKQIEELRRAGISIVQDDLGSGHSSLLRMGNINFDEVKLDQGLIRSTSTNPQRAMEFIYHLTRLAHGFGIPVTIEGLENKGLIEAAAILGVDYGQGFGIGYPMPVDKIVRWHENFSHALNSRQPETPMGALAGYLLWDRQLTALADWPDMIADFVRSPCLVQRYIDNSDKISSTEKNKLQSLLDHNHACAVRGNANPAYQTTRKAVIMALSHQDRTRSP